MRRTIITLFMCLSCMASAWSQTKDETDFKDKIDNLWKKASDASKRKDYKEAVSINNKIIRELDNVEFESLKPNVPRVKATIYYNIACYSSLLKDTKGAVASFQKAIDNGWDKYGHAVKDKDLDYIRGNSKFSELMQAVREKSDFVYILQQSGKYSKENAASLPRFTYSDPNDRNLVNIRQHYNLDSIAGSGDEISKIKNLLHWVHNIVPHDGNSNNPIEKNTRAMIELCKKEGRGVNCRMMAQILNECYLAMGFKSRYVTCMPKEYIEDCHVINAVYSATLDKWLWMDPTFNAYVSDENGNLLGISEVRERLIGNRPLVLNQDANWNNKEKQTKEYYLETYMAKNLYYVYCQVNSCYDAETSKDGKLSPIYVDLLPGGNYKPAKSGSEDIHVRDDKYFWQSPYGN